MTRLETVRLSRGMTRAELAEAAGVNYGTIGRHERGEGDVSDPTLFALAKALKVNPTELVGLAPEPAEAA